MALFPFYILASGLLTGKARKGETPEGRLQMDRYQNFLTDRKYSIIEALRGFAAVRRESMATAAIGCLLAQPTLPPVTPGATRSEQIGDSIEAAGWQPIPHDLVEIRRLATWTGL